jgi:hypothetical protein
LVDVPGNAQQPNDAALAVPVNNEIPETLMVLTGAVTDNPTVNPKVTLVAVAVLYRDSRKDGV